MQKIEKDSHVSYGFSWEKREVNRGGGGLDVVGRGNRMTSGPSYILAFQYFSR